MILNILDWSQMNITPYIPAIDSLKTTGSDMIGYEQRMVEFLRESRNLPVPPATRKASQKQAKENFEKDT